MPFAEARTDRHIEPRCTLHELRYRFDHYRIGLRRIRHRARQRHSPVTVSAPLVESTHNDIEFTAAVVGAILNLALFFGYHVLWPQGFGGGFDAMSAPIALFRYQRNVIHIIGVCALLGLLLKTLL